MATLLPSYTLDLVHLPLRGPKLSGQCAVAMITKFDLEFVVNVGFMGYSGEATADDQRMALKNLGGAVHLANKEFVIKSWEELPADEIALVGLRHQGAHYWIVWNPYVKKAFMDPSLLSASDRLPRYLQDVGALPSIYIPVYFT